MNGSQLARIQAYIRQIRNPRKHRFAVAYLNHLRDGVEIPELPLTVMGRQAVVRRIHAILEGKE